MYIIDLYLKSVFVTRVTIRTESKMTESVIEDFIKRTYPDVKFDRMEVSYVG